MKEIIRMNQLAGLITEGQAKKMMTAIDKKAALKNKRSLKENESSAYITIDPEYPTEVELYADSGDYAGDIEKNGKVTFTLTFDEGDSEGTYMNSKDIFDDHAPAVFKKIVKAGGDFDAGDDYVEVTTTLDKLKKLFPMKESSMAEAKKRATNKYVSMEIEDGEEYPTLNEKAISDYLKSVIDPKQVRAVGTFMNDQEGYGEAAGNFFTGEGDESVTEKEVEDWATMEMSYYLNSSPDDFPFKKGSMKESSKNSLKENDLANDDLIYDRMLNMDQEQLISKILNYAEKNPTSTLVDYLNSEFGYGEEDY